MSTSPVSSRPTCSPATPPTYAAPCGSPNVHSPSWPGQRLPQSKVHLMGQARASSQRNQFTAQRLVVSLSSFFEPGGCTASAAIQVATCRSTRLGPGGFAVVRARVDRERDGLHRRYS